MFLVVDTTTNPTIERSTWRSRGGHVAVVFDCGTRKFNCGCKERTCEHIALVLAYCHVEGTLGAVIALFNDDSTVVTRPLRVSRPHIHTAFEARMNLAYQIMCIDEVDALPYLEVAKYRRPGCACVPHRQVIDPSVVAQLAGTTGRSVDDLLALFQEALNVGVFRAVQETLRPDGSCQGCEYAKEYSVTHDLAQQLRTCTTCDLDASAFKNVAFPGTLYTEFGIVSGIKATCLLCPRCKAVYPPNNCQSDNVFFFNHEIAFTISSLYHIRRSWFKGWRDLTNVVRTMAEQFGWPLQHLTRYRHAWLLFESCVKRYSRLLRDLGAPPQIWESPFPWCAICGAFPPVLLLDCCEKVRCQHDGLDMHVPDDVTSEGVVYAPEQYQRDARLGLLGGVIGGRSDLQVPFYHIRATAHPLMMDAAAASKLPIVTPSRWTFTPDAIRKMVTLFEKNICKDDDRFQSNGAFDVLRFQEHIVGAQKQELCNIAKHMGIPHCSDARNDEVRDVIFHIVKQATHCFTKCFPIDKHHTHGETTGICIHGCEIFNIQQVAPESHATNARLLTMMKVLPPIAVSDSVCGAIDHVKHYLRQRGIALDGRDGAIISREDRLSGTRRISIPGILDGRKGIAIATVQLPDSTATHGLPTVPEHPRFKMKCLFYVHDDFHGDAHKKENCRNRDVGIILECESLNTGMTEQINGLGTHRDGSRRLIVAIGIRVLLLTRPVRIRMQSGSHSIGPQPVHHSL